MMKIVRTKAILSARPNRLPRQIVNFMATHGRGLICAPLMEDRCEELGLELMVGKNTAAFETPLLFRSI
jgi:3,4-dihydroxy-2-butanone 4-phosphate synthase